MTVIPFPSRNSSFRLDGDLPTGLTVLEASAGTGKTFALAALATRAVAERGLSPSELCIVTFTEAATAELRGRVRNRLAEAAEFLAGRAGDDDPVLRRLTIDDDGATCSDDEVTSRRQNLERAVADFDTATISTIHGFCSRVVASGGGVVGSITDDDTDIRELVVDAFLARYGDEEEQRLVLKNVIQAVKLRLRMPESAMLEGAGLSKGKYAEREGLIDEAAELVDVLVERVLERRRAERRRTFDGLIIEARAALTGRPLVGPADAPDALVAAAGATVRALRSRFSLVMIDEFQDTDAVQWDIFRTAFLDPAHGDPVDVVIVGDPKQSIYRFRSAEISAYLAARHYADAHGGTRATLDVNWRTDEHLLDGLGAVFDDTTFGSPEIRFEPVGHDPERVGWGLAGAPGTPLRIRHIDVEEDTPALRAKAVADTVTQVVELLQSGATVPGSDQGSRIDLCASDIAVLVRSNRDATIYADALNAAGVPASSSAGDSVLDSPAADQWRVLLMALEQPASVGRVRAACLGWFVGLSPTEMANLDDEALADQAERLRGWAGCLTAVGLPALLAAVREAGLLGRVLGRAGGERDLTDLDHVAELLNTATGGGRTSPSALLGILDALTASGTTVADEEGVAADVLARRIDRDDDTVKVLTVHKAKGLEYPVVLCPTLWTVGAGNQELAHAVLGDQRLVNTNALVGKTGGSSSDAFKIVATAAGQENAGEALRLLYVALTRAKHQLVVWWAKPPKGRASPLEALLTQGDRKLDLQRLVDAAPHAVSVEVVERPDEPAHYAPASDHDLLAAAEAERQLDRTWAQWSFTGIERAAAARLAAVASRYAATPDVEGRFPGTGLDTAEVYGIARPPDEPLAGGYDEPTADPDADADDAVGALVAEPTVDLADLARRLPLLDLPGGKTFGTLVHGVLERVDFTAADLDDQLLEQCRTSLGYRRMAVDAATLADGLGVALRAPLGGPLGKARLLDVPAGDRLNELDFDLPLGRLTANAIAEVLVEHLPADDRLRPWAEHAAGEGLAVDVEGMLTGSIDLVARTPDGRYWLADYKSNRLWGTDYDRPAMATAMAGAGYPLQAALYLVALHRYLRWRLPAYEPTEHLLGAAYLFVRGMDPDRPADDTRGVFWWQPPASAIVALDALLAGGRP